MNWQHFNLDGMGMCPLEGSAFIGQLAFHLEKGCKPWRALVVREEVGVIPCHRFATMLVTPAHICNKTSFHFHICNNVKRFLKMFMIFEKAKYSFLNVNARNQGFSIFSATKSIEQFRLNLKS